MNTMGCRRLVDDNYLTIYMNAVRCPRLVADNYLIILYEHSGISKVGG